MRRRKLIQKMTAFFLTGTVLFGMMGQSAFAEEIPYDTYNYNYRDYVVLTPAAYVPDGAVTGQDVGTTALSEPQDFCVSPEGLIYIADMKNNRIVVLDEEMKQTVRVIESFTRDGKEDTFNQPYGVCVSEKGLLYVADSMNKRIVVLSAEGEFIKIIDNPQSEILEENF